MSVTVKSVREGSLASAKGIEAGSQLLSINGNEIVDALDYNFYSADTVVRLAVKSVAGKMKLVKITKRENEDLGLEFETYLMDKQRACKNKCIFCFIDQLPKGLRKSLYFKDDDSRLSFLFGNYITLTNLDEHEVERIIKMHISPVNVSVHTMNPDLRVEMMKNPNAGKSLAYLERFAAAGIKLNTQLVLCPSINDGAELEYSLKSLAKLYPAVESIAAVPVGLTKHRENLPTLTPYNAQTSQEVIDIIDRFNDEFESLHGTRIAYAADEFFLKAGKAIPDESYYGDYPQLENGVGLWALMKSEFVSALADEESCDVQRKITLATGKAAYPLMCDLAKKACEKFKGLKVNVVAVENMLLGSSVTVAGLLSGGDYLNALKDLELGEELLIPLVSLRREEDVFLDDMTVSELSEALNIKITPVSNDGYELLTKIIGGVD